MPKRKTTPFRMTFIALFSLAICSMALWSAFLPGVSVSDSISKILYTPTSTPIPPTPVPPTPTVTPLPLEVSEMEGTTVQTLCLEVQEIYPQITEDFSLSIYEDILDTLSGLGLRIAGSGEACDATLTIEVTIIAIKGKYSGTTCYAGYVGDVQTILSSQEDASEVVISRDFKRELPTVVTESDCQQEVSEALYDRFEKVGNYHLPRALLETLVELWGPQILIPVLGGPLRDPADDMLAEAGSVFIPDLMRALEGEATRWGAANALGKMGPEATDAVPALIDSLSNCCEHLERESWCDNHQKHYSNVLKDITGQDLGQDPEAWRDWWSGQ